MAPVPKTMKKTARSIEKPTERPIEKPILKPKKMKKKKYSGFSIYIYKVLKSITNNEFRISNHSMVIMNNLVNDMLENLAEEASRLIKHSKKTTMSAHDILSAVRLLLPGELAKHANIEGQRAITLYAKSRAKED